jgi:hypothetical protein
MAFSEHERAANHAALEWCLYEPQPLHESLQDALAVIDDDRYGCFFG